MGQGKAVLDFSVIVLFLLIVQSEIKKKFPGSRHVKWKGNIVTFIKILPFLSL